MGDMSSPRIGCGGGGLIALLTLLPLPTGFLLGMATGGPDSISLDATAEDCVGLTVVVSLGGRGGPGGRESVLTGGTASSELSREGGSGRAFE